MVCNPYRLVMSDISKEIRRQVNNHWSRMEPACTRLQEPQPLSLCKYAERMQDTVQM